MCIFICMKRCTKCEDDRELINFPKNNRYKSGYNSICKICMNDINKIYRDDNIENIKKNRKEHYQRNIEKMRKEKKEYYAKNKSKKSLYDVEYRKNNSDKIKQYKKEWETLNKDNPLFRIKRNLRRRVHHALEDNKKSDATFELIGCTPDFFKDYITNLMLEGMSWDNYGEWHIDHIIPCFTFDLSNPEQQKLCFHYTNQRPLWKKDNLSRPRNIF